MFSFSTNRNPPPVFHFHSSTLVSNSFFSMGMHAPDKWKVSDKVIFNCFRLFDVSDFLKYILFVRLIIICFFPLSSSKFLTLFFSLIAIFDSIWMTPCSKIYFGFDKNKKKATNFFHYLLEPLHPVPDFHEVLLHVVEGQCFIYVRVTFQKPRGGSFWKVA